MADCIVKQAFFGSDEDHDVRNFGMAGGLGGAGLGGYLGHANQAGLGENLMDAAVRLQASSPRTRALTRLLLRSAPERADLLPRLLARASRVSPRGMGGLGALLGLGVGGLAGMGLGGLKN